MNNVKIFSKYYNSVSGVHEFCRHDANQEALQGTGMMDLVDLQDYLRLEEQLKTTEEKLKIAFDCIRTCRELFFLVNMDSYMLCDITLKQIKEQRD